MKVKPLGMLPMMLAGWLNRLPGAAGRTFELLPEGRLMDRTNRLTAPGAQVLHEPIHKVGLPPSLPRYAPAPP